MKLYISLYKGDFFQVMDIANLSVEILHHQGKDSSVVPRSTEKNNCSNKIDRTVNARKRTVEQELTKNFLAVLPQW